MTHPDRRRAGFVEVRSFVGDVYGADLHAKRIDSLTGATLGVMQSASLAVAMIGHALVQARGLITKHAINRSIVCSATTASTCGTASPAGWRIRSASGATYWWRWT